MVEVIQAPIQLLNDSTVTVMTRSDAITSWFSSKYPSQLPNECSLVVHIGGCATEVVTYRTINGRAAIMTQPNCVMSGGSKSNSDFLQYVGKNVVEDEHFHKYLQQYNGDSLEQAKLKTLSIDFFELAKIRFLNCCDTTQQYFGIDLPPAFVNVYDHLLLNSDIKLIERSGFLQISSLKMQELIDLTLSQVFIPIDAALEEAVDENLQVNNIYLIGQFGSSRYVRDKIVSRYNATAQPVLINVHSVSDDLLVLHGSFSCFNLNMPLRKSSVSYGIGCAELHNGSNLSDTRNHALLNDEGRLFEFPKFHPFIRKGDLIDPQTLYKFSLQVTPLYADQSMLSFILYCIKKDNLTSLLDSRTGDLSDGVVQLNQLDIRLPTRSAFSLDIMVELKFYWHEIISFKITTENDTLSNFQFSY